MDAKHRAVILTLALVATSLAGCVGSEDLASSSSDQANLGLHVQTQGTAAYDALQATVTQATLQGPDGPQELTTSGAVDLLSEDPVTVATATVPPGNYTSFSLVIASVQGTHEGEPVAFPAVDRTITVEAPVPAAAGSTTDLFIALNLEDAVTDDGFQAQASFLGARQDGEIVLEPDEGKTAPEGEPPVARARVFNGTGALVFGSDFVAEDGTTQPVNRQAEITFVASDSTDPDGSVTSFRWVFSDGAVEEGSTVRHTFEDGGVEAVRLEVTDDSGSTDDLTIQIPVRFLVNEDGEVGYSASESGELLVGSANAENEEDVTFRSHSFAIPDFFTADDASGDEGGDTGEDQDASWEDPTDIDAPVHGGESHGVPEGEDPSDFRKLARSTFTLTSGDELNEFTLVVERESGGSWSASGNGTITVQLSQLDGYYLNGGNYTATVFFDQGVQASYDLSVQATYIPVPVQASGGHGGH